MERVADPNPTATEKEFLGDEFLTWLWYRCLRDGGEFALADKTRVGVVVDDYLVLGEAAADGLGAEHIIRRGMPARTAEARTAFLAGKRVRRMKLVIGTPEGDWAFTLDGASLDLQSLKTPPIEASHPEDRMVEKLSSIEGACRTVDGLYEMFLAERLDPSWESRVVPKMRAFFGRAE